ncbi:prenyltransferase/squalene oxidase repeat-containing protein [Neorhodopirellula pilleata]|uniref:prenyltransferase/squalene oxidase repeat-containing protein n=1 Tax=Neorhodopirellula pilleata TaxID=2714738 RepID=UPI001E6477EA|nr:prenyltransferase/squalene oxidase repeat-containing protein [Neorhodopirellula pilleata]
MLLKPGPSPKQQTVALKFYHPKAIKQRIEDAPAWLVSMVVHLVLLLVLALISTSSGAVGRIVLTMTHGKDEITTELAEFSIEPIELSDLPDTFDFDSETEVDLEPIEFDTKIKLASLAPKLESLEPSVELPMTKLSASATNMFAGRTGAMKQKLLREAGGTAATEDAVSLGLEWLKQNQLKDGTWSLRGPYDSGARSENQVSATAMAMLAFMGAGSTHRGGQYQKELWRAVKWLVKQQDRQGFMAVRSADHEKMYAQAQAMIALCELYAMTGDSWIRPYAQASCDFACRSQSPQGGWRYQPRYDSDTSVTGWFVMGLKSGEAAGLNVDSYVWPRVERYLDSVSTRPENDYYAAVGYSYKVGDIATPSMTAEGLLCRQYMGLPRNMPGMAQGLGALVQNHPINVRQSDVYYWYYATQSLHHYGGPLWTQWNDKMKVALPAEQELNGRERGSWSPQNDAWGRHAGRLYTTCFSLYCLEVYYRHMPLYASDLDAE